MRIEAKRWHRVARRLVDFTSSVAVLVAFSSATQCTEKKESSVASPAPISAAEMERMRTALHTYSDLAYALYSESVLKARVLLNRVEELGTAPSAAALRRAQDAWLEARVPYQQSEVFRFYDGPIDRVEMEINTWPIDEGYVERQPGSDVPGIVDDRDRYPTLSQKLLSALNGKEGETSVSTGYHVIEYLLWGVDLRSDGPGERNFSDYVGQDGSIAARRAQYLRFSTLNLVDNLKSVQEAWAPENQHNYRARFLALDPQEALALVIKGMGTLSGTELAGERLTVACETKFQENEHSCFSDSTTLDLIENGQGLQNVCLGRYQRQGQRVVDGLGVCDVVATRDPALGERLRTEIEASLVALRAIPAPFDQAILGDDSAPGRQSIWRAIRALEQQAYSLAQVAISYDLRPGAGVSAEAR